MTILFSFYEQNGKEPIFTFECKSVEALPNVHEEMTFETGLSDLIDGDVWSVVRVRHYIRHEDISPSDPQRSGRHSHDVAVKLWRVPWNERRVLEDATISTE